VHELLTWFLSAAEAGAGDDHAALALPTSCTKGQRAVWHSAAQRVGLHSESMVSPGQCHNLRITAC
jgi:hypothetical protein